MSNDQTHPLHETDKNIIDSLISKENPEDQDFINLARLINRYSGFPGELKLKMILKKFLNSGKFHKMIFLLKLEIFGQIISGLLIPLKNLLDQDLTLLNRIYEHIFINNVF